MTTNSTLTVAFSGYRPFSYDYKEANNIKLRARIYEGIKKLVDWAKSQGYKKVNFISPLGIGAEQMAALEVIRLKATKGYKTIVKLEAMCPARDQSKPWHEAQLEVYKYLLENADVVEYHCDIYDRDCLRNNSNKMVEKADKLITIWDERKKDETSKLIVYAHEKQVKVSNINPYKL